MSELVERIAEVIPGVWRDVPLADAKRIARSIIVMVVDEVAGKATPPMPVGPDVLKVRAYLVRSRTDAKVGYVVIVDPMIWCPCNDFRFRQPKICDHIQDAIHEDSVKTT